MAKVICAIAAALGVIIVDMSAHAQDEQVLAYVSAMRDADILLRDLPLLRSDASATLNTLLNDRLSLEEAVLHGSEERHIGLWNQVHPLLAIPEIPEGPPGTSPFSAVRMILVHDDSSRLVEWLSAGYNARPGGPWDYKLLTDDPRLQVLYKDSGNWNIGFVRTVLGVPTGLFNTLADGIQIAQNSSYLLRGTYGGTASDFFVDDARGRLYTDLGASAARAYRARALYSALSLASSFTLERKLSDGSIFLSNPDTTMSPRPAWLFGDTEVRYPEFDDWPSPEDESNDGDAEPESPPQDLPTEAPVAPQAQVEQEGTGKKPVVVQGPR